MTADADIIEALRGAGLAGEGEVVLQPLTGGVSCDVWKVDSLAGPIVVKRPLPQLRVAAEWLAPVERGTSEVRWLRRARGVDPYIAPEVLAELPTGHAFAMRFLPGCPVWKDELMAGRVDAGFAAQVGKGIAAVHAATAYNDADRADFPNDHMFRALRVDPFLLYVAQQDAELAPALTALAADLSGRKIALVHGDVSPKNILVSADGPVFLDAECAVYGDPAFDLAFCTTHLLLKAVWSGDVRLNAAAATLVAAYRAGIDWEDAEDLLLRAGKLTAALLLARVEGKSPAPYLTDPEHKTIVRDQARALIRAPEPIDTLVANWKRI
ncbi:MULTISPECIES: phosphotransferase family protein [unclassified Sphingopyxis]|uniref:phosphotransferase family protein n=1 Tax=unclassified Sphingopyxis TaxID=2614943 RepID=UPI00073679D1|nr:MULTISPECIES: aminoglycoside phosphotransferase family protein [unclassified Sphingopyxis]KTE32232.1 aminoglycoside phosphotransferase [Sphingopyxis sp. HIX]KTE80690.1 aminoglycoside phosphotransferase [Sphingopyxis sp. HXXIV]